MSEHTITLMRDDDRMGHHYGQHYIIERMGESVIKREWVGTDGVNGTYDRHEALNGAAAAASIYGAKLIDRRPDECLYGWSAD